MFGLGCQGLRHMYGKKPIEKLPILKASSCGYRRRSPKTRRSRPTGPSRAYAVWRLHRIADGVADMAENGINNYLINNITSPAGPFVHRARSEQCRSFCDDKAWGSLTDEQKKWVQAAADEVSQNEPTVAFKLEHDALGKLEKMGVKVVKNVDKSGFSQISKPIQDKLASDLGPHAVKDYRTSPQCEITQALCQN